jgi:lactate dehydrogenase-like 2-hydroxyacid dehydrogenase
MEKGAGYPGRMCYGFYQQSGLTGEERVGDAVDRIVVTRVPPGLVREDLAAAGELWAWEEDRAIPRPVLLEQVATADGLYCMLTEAVDGELLAAAPRLRVVSNMAVGVDNVDLAACTGRGIPVGHTPEVLTETTADTVFALLLAAARRVVEGAAYVRAGRWGPWDPGLLLGAEVHGSTLGIVGLGRIGKAVARRARGFGMRVLYTGRTRNLSAERDLPAEYLPLPELLAAADHVVVQTPLTPETRHLIDAAALARMKPTATLVNAARGGLVDPAALYAALTDRVIAAAGLDVTEPEPIAPDDPLLSLPNCVILPHLGSASRRTREAMAALAVENLLAGLRGEPLPALANPQISAAAG